MIILPGGDVPTYGDTLLQIDDLLVGLELEGVSWVFEEIAGWRHGAGVETNFNPRPGQHGEIDGPAYRRGRVIVVKGACLASSRSLAEDASDAIAALLADGSLGSFTTQSPHGTRTAQVRLSDTPMSSWLNSMAFRWQLQFTAPDWRKYGESQTLDTDLPGGGTGMAFPMAFPMEFGDPGNPGRIQFTNDGRAPSEPTFTITPPMLSGFEVTRVETGQRLRYTLPVLTPLTIDCAAGTVIEAGERRERFLTVREWPSVLPGETATFQFSTLGSETVDDPARLSGSFAPAYP